MAIKKTLSEEDLSNLIRFFEILIEIDEASSKGVQ